jgi:hypothetical protein
MRKTNWMANCAAAVVLFALAGCSGTLTYTIAGTPKSADLDGKIIANPNKDRGMTTLKIDLEHLAPPERLGTGKVFVMWSKDEKGKWNRIGAMKYDAGGRKANFEDVTVPLMSFDLVLTVEADALGEAPTSDPVLIQHVN